MRNHRASIVTLLLAILATPAAADPSPALRGRFEAEAGEGIVKRFHFHRDHTYEWTQTVRGAHLRLWACGRYEIRNELLVLFEDKSERSCHGGKSSALANVSEQWMHFARARHGNLTLGGEHFARLHLAAPPAQQDSAPQSDLLSLSLR